MADPPGRKYISHPSPAIASRLVVMSLTSQGDFLQSLVFHSAMFRSHTLLATLFLTLACLPAPILAADSPPPGKPVSYWKDVRPIFQANCTGCHQPAKAKGDYVMTDFASLIKGGADDGAAITAKDPEHSSLIKNITPAADGTAEMPKKADPLKPAEIALIRRWIDEGAADDTPAQARQLYDAAHLPRYAQAPLVSAIDFSPDGKKLAVAGFHEVLIIDPATSQLAARYVGQSERIESVRYSPDGTKLAITGGQPGRMGEVQIWDAEKHQLILSQCATFDTLYGASWSPDGKNIAFGGSDKSVRALSVETGKQTFFVLTHEDWVQDTAWSVKGDQVMSVGRDMTAKLSDFATQRFIDNITSITPGALRGGLQALVRHPLRDEILVGGSDGQPRLYRTNREVERKIGDDSNLIRQFPAITGRIWAADFAPDGKSLVVSGTHTDENAIGTLITGVLAVYTCDVDTKLPDDLKDIFRKGTFGGAEKAKIDAYTTQGVKQVFTVTLPTGLYTTVYQPDGQRIACAGTDGCIRLLSPTDGTVLHEIRPFPLTP
jgi:WD40 repeat protein/mono/diheme cytochrome c family protein